MPGLSICPKPAVLSLLTCILLLCAGRSRAQSPESPASPASLEKRVHELEDTVRRLEAERSPAAMWDPDDALLAGPMRAFEGADFERGRASGRAASLQETVDAELAGA